MKKRLIKKLINKHLIPLVKGMPKSDSYAYTIDSEPIDGLVQVRVFNNNHVFYDGYEVKEGCVPHPSIGIKNGIFNTKKAIENIKDYFEIVILRMGPDLYHGRIYLRLITDQVTK